MATEHSKLKQQIEAGKPLLLAEITPPYTGRPEAVVEIAKRFAGKVHALGVGDNRDRVGMSALAAASLIAAEGVETILHVVTRDRNRIALVSDYLGAQALGIRNVLCTSGTHQTLGSFHAAKNVFDIDVIQLLDTYRGLADDASLIGQKGVNGSRPTCFGAVASPMADPMELQVIRLGKKVTAGAQFLITQPVFDIERFRAWYEEVTRRGLHEKAAIIAGIQPLGDAVLAKALAAKRPSPGVPAALIERIISAADPAAQRAASIEIATETIRQLSELDGLRGFHICGDEDVGAALEVIDKSGLGVE